MLIFTIIVLSMALLSAIFWAIEGRAAYKALHIKPEFKTGLAGVANVGIALKWLIDVIVASKYLAVDVFCTFTITGLFGLSGVIGTAMGLTISNVISVALLIAKFKEKR